MRFAWQYLGLNMFVVTCVREQLRGPRAYHAFYCCPGMDRLVCENLAAKQVLVFQVVMNKEVHHRSPLAMF